jgi:hypothetical protein
MIDIISYSKVLMALTEFGPTLDFCFQVYSKNIF